MIEGYRRHSRFEFSGVRKKKLRSCPTPDVAVSKLDVLIFVVISLVTYLVTVLSERLGYRLARSLVLSVRLTLVQ